MKIFILPFFLIFLNCDFKEKELNSSNSRRNFLNKIEIDSLKNKGFIFTNEIDFFTLSEKDTIFPTEKNFDFFAIKKEIDTIQILNFNWGKITLERKLNRYKSGYFYEDIIIDSSDGGEINYLTYYYSKNKIIITEITKSIFEEDDISCYFDQLIIIDNQNVIEYYYKLGNNFHLNKNHKYLLSKNQLENIENIALTLFYDKENVNTQSFPFKDLMKEKLYLWEINQIE
jgi:hypothetical protein